MKKIILQCSGLLALLCLTALINAGASHAQSAAPIQPQGTPAIQPQSAAVMPGAIATPIQTQNATVMPNAVAGAKTAIIIVTEGSSREDSRRAFLDFEASVRKNYPNMPVLRAYTSATVRDTVRGTPEEAPSLAGALSVVADTGYAKAAILAVVTLPGRKYEDIRKTAAAFAAMPAGLAEVSVSLPLIGSEEDAYSISAALMDNFPSESRNGDAVLFIGPSTDDRNRDIRPDAINDPTSDSMGSLAYPALSWGLFRQGKRGSLYLTAFLGNTESLKDCLNILKMNKIKNVQLVPLLTLLDDADHLDIFGKLPQAGQTGSLAGQPDQTGQAGQLDQAGQQAAQLGQSDLAGLTGKSVAATLIREGFTVTPQPAGLLSNTAMTAIWRAKLQQILNK
ncbi:MAG: sirohydrochlorin cobaltochelatase [Deltaproteobacteria bacterium]|jgi:sirohydrochlorin cobaltochelatase|nr:sirohydrochlorin cobaltochelatase [Deltaproteobacteria bacterium]